MVRKLGVFIWIMNWTHIRKYLWCGSDTLSSYSLSSSTMTVLCSNVIVSNSSLYVIYHHIAETITTRCCTVYRLSYWLLCTVLHTAVLLRKRLCYISCDLSNDRALLATRCLQHEILWCTRRLTTGAWHTLLIHSWQHLPHTKFTSPVVSM